MLNYKDIHGEYYNSNNMFVSLNDFVVKNKDYLNKVLNEVNNRNFSLVKNAFFYLKQGLPPSIPHSEGINSNIYLKIFTDDLVIDLIKIDNQLTDRKYTIDYIVSINFDVINELENLLSVKIIEHIHN